MSLTIYGDGDGRLCVLGYGSIEEWWADQEAPAVELVVLDDFLANVGDELRRAQAKWPPMNSAHEAYAVILEELDELWAEVRKKQTEHDHSAMYAELVQIAAMAARAAADVVLPAIRAGG